MYRGGVRGRWAEVSPLCGAESCVQLHGTRDITYHLSRDKKDEYSVTCDTIILFFEDGVSCKPNTR